MSRKNVSFVFGAGAVFLALLFFALTPLAVISLSFLMIPVVVLYVKLDFKRFWIWYVALLLILNLVLFVLGAGMSGAGLSLIALFFLIPSIVMGRLYKKNSPARTALVSGGIVLLAELLLLLSGLALSGLSISAHLKSMVNESIAGLPPELAHTFTTGMTDAVLNMVVQMLPLYMIFFSVYYMTLTHWLGRRILNGSGETVPGLRPIREMRLPGSLIWYYIAALLLDFFIVRGTGSILYTVLLNLIPILMFLFALQAVSFFFYWAHIKGRGRGLPIAALIVMLIFPPIQQLFALLGMFDIAFPIRERLK